MNHQVTVPGTPPRIAQWSVTRAASVGELRVRLASELRQVIDDQARFVLDDSQPLLAGNPPVLRLVLAQPGAPLPPPLAVATSGSGSLAAATAIAASGSSSTNAAGGSSVGGGSALAAGAGAAQPAAKKDKKDKRKDKEHKEHKDKEHKEKEHKDKDKDKDKTEAREKDKEKQETSDGVVAHTAHTLKKIVFSPITLTSAVAARVGSGGSGTPTTAGSGPDPVISGPLARPSARPGPAAPSGSSTSAGAIPGTSSTTSLSMSDRNSTSAASGTSSTSGSISPVSSLAPVANAATAPQISPKPGKGSSLSNVGSPRTQQPPAPPPAPPPSLLTQSMQGSGPLVRSAPGSEGRKIRNPNRVKTTFLPGRAAANALLMGELLSGGAAETEAEERPGRASGVLPGRRSRSLPVMRSWEEPELDGDPHELLAAMARAARPTGSKLRATFSPRRPTDIAGPAPQIGRTRPTGASSSAGGSPASARPNAAATGVAQLRPSHRRTPSNSSPEAGTPPTPVLGLMGGQTSPSPLGSVSGPLTAGGGSSGNLLADVSAPVASAAQPQQQLVLKKDGGVQAGSLDQLMGLLLGKTAPSSELVDDFLLGFRYFVEPRALLSLLSSRFDAFADESGEWRHMLRLRVINLLRRWVELCFWDFERDAGLRDQLAELLEHVVSASAGTNVRKWTEKLRLYVAERHQTMLVAHFIERYLPALLADDAVRAASPGGLLPGSVLVERLAALLRVPRPRANAVANQFVPRLFVPAAPQGQPAPPSDVLTIRDSPLSWYALPVGPVRDDSPILPAASSAPAAAPPAVAGSADKDKDSDELPRPLLPHRFRELDDVQLLKLHPTELARQLALLEHALLVRIEPDELLTANWKRDTRSVVAPHVVALIDHFNRIQRWCSTELITTTNLKQRRLVLSRWIFVALECRKLNNYNALMEVLSALQSVPIQRLKQTWKGLAAKDLQQFHELVEFMDFLHHFKRYRDELERLETLAPPPAVLPYIGLFLQDLLMIEEIPTRTKAQGDQPQLVNFQKMSKLAAVIRKIQRYQARPFTLRPVELIREWITTDRPGRGLPVLSDADLERQSKLVETKDN